MPAEQALLAILSSECVGLRDDAGYVYRWECIDVVDLSAYVRLLTHPVYCRPVLSNALGLGGLVSIVWLFRRRFGSRRKPPG
jgi:hypothetical protein